MLSTLVLAETEAERSQACYISHQTRTSRLLLRKLHKQLKKTYTVVHGLVALWLQEKNIQVCGKHLWFFHSRCAQEEQ